MTPPGKPDHLTTDKFLKLYRRVLDSTIWAEDATVFKVFMTMLLECDENGFYDGSLIGLARRAFVTREQCADALKVLAAPDPDSRTKTADGRRIVEVATGGWIIVNALKYRAMRTANQEYEAERKRRLRQKLKGGGSEPRSGAMNPSPTLDLMVVERSGSSQVVAAQHDDDEDGDGDGAVGHVPDSPGHRDSPGLSQKGSTSTSSSSSSSVVAVSDKELRTTKKPVRREGGALTAFLVSHGLDAPDYDGLFEHFITTQKSPQAVMARLRQHLDGSKKNIPQVTADELAVAVLEYMGKYGAVQFDARLFGGYVANVKEKHREARERDAALARISAERGSEVTTADLNAANVGWRVIQAIAQGVSGPPPKRK